MTKLKIASVLTPGLLFLQNLIAKADVAPTYQQVPLANATAVLLLLNRVMDWLFVFFFAVSALFILWAAWDYLMSQGDEKKVEGVKNKLLYSFVGIAVALIAKAVPTFVQGFITP